MYYVYTDVFDNVHKSLKCIVYIFVIEIYVILKYVIIIINIKDYLPPE